MSPGSPGPVSAATASAVTTHVLDTARGQPAAGVAVRLVFVSGDDRPGDGPTELDTGAYFAGQGSKPAFFPEVAITFRVDGQSPHHHVPLLLSPFAYSTYRGS